MGLEGQRDRLRCTDAEVDMQRSGGLMHMKGGVRGRWTEEAGGPLSPSASVWGSG